MSQAGSLGVGGSGRSTTVAVSTFQPNVVLQEFDDFISANNAGNISKLTWDNFGTSPRSTQGTATNPGILRFQPAAAASLGLYLRQSPVSGNQIDPIPIGAGVLSQSWIVQLSALSGGANTYRFSCGFGDAQTMNAGGTPDAFVNGIYFQYTDTANAGQWTLNCTNTSVTTTVNTATAVTTNFVTLTIVVNAGGTSVSFYVDNTLVGSAITTNIPTVSLTPMVMAIRTAGTVPVTNIDLYYINLDLTTPRPGPTFSQAVVGTGQLIEQYVATPISYQVLNTDAIIGVTSTAAARTITMPASSLVTGQRWTIKDESGGAGTNNITINGNGKNIDGAATFVINTNYGAVDLYYSGLNFFVI